jgi:hypothetical protein
MMSLFRHGRSGAAGRVLLLGVVLAAIGLGGRAPSAQSDLDAFMRDVLAERDTNWKKLQQYVLDEREQVELRGPEGRPLWGERRDYTWYIRDGFFVRSPVRVNGSAIGESDRVKYEQEFLERERAREARARASGDEPINAPVAEAETPRDVDGLIRQTRQPQFISSAYFLRFKFDEGRYAFVGRETLDGRDVLRVEYYPEKLFTPEDRRARADDGPDPRRRPPDDPASQSMERELMRLMNKSSKVTLWIEPAAHQIVKYTFDDLGWNFFPGQWLAQVDGVSASMTMGQPFPDVWLPNALDMNVRMMLAIGTVDFRYQLQYENYRQADVRTRIGIPDRP